MKINVSFILIAFFCIGSSTLAQEKNDFVRNQFKFITEVPVQFGVGFELKYTRRFSSAMQLGVLTQPNSTLILNTLKALGTSEEVVLMLQDAFMFGLVYKGTFNYNFRKNYVGGYVQIIGLKGNDTPTSLVETVMGVNISSYPKYAGKSSTSPTVLSLNSTLVQAGVLYGRRIPIKKKSEIDLEFGVSANVGSSSSLHSDTRNLSALSDYTNSYLAAIYKSYAFVPSITVAYAIKIGK